MDDSTDRTDIPATTTKDDVDEDIPIIRANQYILIKMPSGNQKVVTLRPGSLVSLGKFGSFQADDLVGQTFGHSYEIYGKNQVRVTSNWALEEVEETDANNREIFDNSSTQKLSFFDIEKLKEEGLKGELEGKDIIQKMVESHATFGKKTEFSKAKYIQRKQKNNMRIDTLSQMLSFGNVHANSKVLVVDDTQGLVISAVAERMGGFGTILGVHDSDNHNYDILRYMNFSKHVLDSVMTLPWSKVVNNTEQENFDYKSEEELNAMKDMDRNGYYRRKKGYEKLQAAKQSLRDGKFDGLIVASQYTAVSILETLLPYVGGSRPIVIYSIHKEVKDMTHLYFSFVRRMRMDAQVSRLFEPSNYGELAETISGSYFTLDLLTALLRHHSPHTVLPGRTHPEMTTTGGAGYILTATRVIDFPTQAAMGSRKNRAELDAENGGSSSSSGTRGRRWSEDRRRRGSRGGSSGGRGGSQGGNNGKRDGSEQASETAAVVSEEDTNAMDMDPEVGPAGDKETSIN
ncbi:Gcd10p family-domain-containing protein [Endogone sp. FLAS-F59071]|nr:Gcd10p family-domain-containing protein [Endogone sp. FLAS-F59071]|eukprot:RUS19839.1 Gcd10p family-domain-containing protein [Endogone sp. FLAS-F59071]